MYRALAWKARHDGIDLADEPAVAALAAQARFETGDGRIRIDGHDVAAAIRTPEMDAAAAIVARQPRVREALIARQRELGAGGGRRDGRARHRDGRVPGRGREDLSRRVAGGARPPARAPIPSHTSGRGTAAISDVATALAERDRIDRTRTASPLVAGRRRGRDRHHRPLDRRRGGTGAGGRGKAGRGDSGDSWRNDEVLTAELTEIAEAILFLRYSADSVVNTAPSHVLSL